MWQDVEDMEKHSLIMLTVFINLNATLVYFMCVALNILPDFIDLLSVFKACKQQVNHLAISHYQSQVSDSWRSNVPICRSSLYPQCQVSHTIMVGLLSTFYWSLSIKSTDSDLAVRALLLTCICIWRTLCPLSRTEDLVHLQLF